MDQIAKEIARYEALEQQQQQQQQYFFFLSSTSTICTSRRELRGR
jgi:hypothetical protein